MAVSLVWIVTWFFFADKLPFKKRPETLEEKEVAVDPNGDIKVPFYRLLMLPSFWGLAPLSFAGYLFTSLKVTWLPAFMNEGLGYSMQTVGVLVLSPTFAQRHCFWAPAPFRAGYSSVASPREPLVLT